ncbi:hypothetical protein Glove_172g61 [Diversispora epigaea]|uniref:Pentacotripeptide-repeat region of PRORP domain-containing protein n=1 Tax=Diversispora epigaea TaxID=1348612 RepID=A0A397IPA5_9GLOM|nr:hypothetical protein Glove_172g61 [Diversispora epigaea]
MLAVFGVGFELFTILTIESSLYQFRHVHNKNILHSQFFGSHFLHNINTKEKSNHFLKYDNNDNSSLNLSFYHFLSTNHSLFNNKKSLQCRHFFTTPHQFRVKIDVKPIDPKLELPTDPYVLSEWVQNLGKADKLDDAISIVWHSKKDAQSEVVWNNLIVECVKKKKVKMGFQLFIEMKKHGFVPNYHTFTILLNGLAEHRPFVDNIAQARSLIDKMQSSTKANPVELNVFHVNCLLKLCGRLNNFEALQGNFNEMMNIGNWSPNQETFTIMLNACSRQGEKGFLVAIQIWNHINSIIGGEPKTTRSQQPRESDGYGPDNEGVNLVMDDELVRSMLLVCKKTERYDKGFEILREVYGLSSATLDHDDNNINGSLNYNKSMSSFTISYRCAMTEKSLDLMLALCIGSRQYEKGILLFDEALSQFHNLNLDIYNFNKLISCYNQTGQFSKSIDTRYAIKARGLEPTLETYDMFLTACRITEDWIIGKEFFETIIATKKLELCLDSHLLNMILELAMLKRKPGNSPKKIRWVLKQIESFGPSDPLMINKLSKTPKKSVMNINYDDDDDTQISNINNHISLNMPAYNIRDERFLRRIIFAYESALEKRFISELDEELINQWQENLDFYKSVAEYDLISPWRIKPPKKSNVQDKNQQEDLSVKRQMKDEILEKKKILFADKQGNVIKRPKKMEKKEEEEEIQNKDMRSAWRYIDQYVGKGGIDQKVARIYEEEGEFSETGRTVKGRYPKAFFDENYNEYDDAIVDSYGESLRNKLLRRGKKNKRDDDESDDDDDDDDDEEYEKYIKSNKPILRRSLVDVNYSISKSKPIPPNSTYPPESSPPSPSRSLLSSPPEKKEEEEEIQNKDMRSAWRYIDQYVGKGGIDQKVARIYEEEGEFSETGRTVKGRYPKAFFDENYNEYDDAIVDSYGESLRNKLLRRGKKNKRDDDESDDDDDDDDDEEYEKYIKSNKPILRRSLVDVNYSISKSKPIPPNSTYPPESSPPSPSRSLLSSPPPSSSRSLLSSPPLPSSSSPPPPSPPSPPPSSSLSSSTRVTQRSPRYFDNKREDHREDFISNRSIRNNRSNSNNSDDGNNSFGSTFKERGDTKYTRAIGKGRTISNNNNKDFERIKK